MLQVGLRSGEEQDGGVRRYLAEAETRERSRELENRLGSSRLWDLERFSDEEGYRDRSRHSHIRLGIHVDIMIIGGAGYCSKLIFEPIVDLQLLLLQVIIMFFF